MAATARSRFLGAAWAGVGLQAAIASVLQTLAADGNPYTEQILGVHIIGLHAADLIQECANAMAAGTTVRDLA